MSQPAFPTGGSARLPGVALGISCFVLSACANLSGLQGGPDAGVTDSTAGDAGATPDAGADATADAGEGGSSSEASADASSYAATVLSDHPVAYYRLGETSGTTAFDSSGNHLDGTYGSGVTRGVPGLLGRDADLAMLVTPPPDAGTRDVNAVVRVPPNPLLQPLRALTVECWIRATQVRGELVSYGPDLAPPFQPYTFQLPGNLELYMANVSDARGTSALQANATAYIVATFDTQMVTFYIDGLVDTTVGATGILQNYDTQNGLGLGGSYTGNDIYSGVLDEVAIYAAVLPADRIAAHFAAGLP